MRFAMFLLWGLLSTGTWSLVLRSSWRAWTEHRDRRSKRELMRDAALTVTAIGSTLSILGILLGEDSGTPRAIALAVALGTFLGAALITLGLRRSEDRGEEP